MITWLASYPKSGNTWLRIFLTNYLLNGDSPADINALKGGPIASARQWFDEWAGVEASLLNDTVIERLRPDVYRCMARENPEMLYMKVHDAWGRTDRGEALFPADVTAGVIYILRNPLDIAASLANHYGLTIAEAVSVMGNADHALARSLGGLNDQLCQRLGTWSGHVQSWLDTSGLPVCAVRYEDLLDNPNTTFAEVIRFCGLPFDKSRLQRAIEFSSFAEAQHQEQAKGFREQSVKSKGSFFRRGRSGGWQEELSSDLAAKIIANHGTIMCRFGYVEKEC